MTVSREPQDRSAPAQTATPPLVPQDPHDRDQYGVCRRCTDCSDPSCCSPRACEGYEERDWVFRSTPGRSERRPAYETCPDCGVRWGYHRGVSCAEAEQRERAVDHAS